MGIIFIKDIQSRLDKTISYIGNKKKTLNENYEEIFLDLHNALDYTVDDLKTEQKFYVDGINCRYENALNKMTETKKEWHKTDKILGYHIIQSFAPGEGTPESIHELGKEFARKPLTNRKKSSIINKVKIYTENLFTDKESFHYEQNDRERRKRLEGQARPRPLRL